VGGGSAARASRRRDGGAAARSPRSRRPHRRRVREPGHHQMGPTSTGSIALSGQRNRTCQLVDTNRTATTHRRSTSTPSRARPTIHAVLFRAHDLQEPPVFFTEATQD
jgi:hypothetical protein